MIDSAAGRAVAVLVLLAAQATLFPLYAQQPVDPEAHVYPTEADFVGDPAPHLGERVSATGFVRETTPLTIRLDARTGPYTLGVVAHDLSPERGDKVRVFGVLASPHEIRAIDGFVVPRRGRWYAWGISVLAGLWVLRRLVAHWRVDRATLGFAPRETPRSVRALIGRSSDSREDR